MKLKEIVLAGMMFLGNNCKCADNSITQERREALAAIVEKKDVFVEKFSAFPQEKKESILRDLDRYGLAETQIGRDVKRLEKKVGVLGFFVDKPGVVNGFKGVGDKDAIVANCTTHAHDPDEIGRIDPFTKEIPYDWDLKHG